MYVIGCVYFCERSCVYIKYLSLIIYIYIYRERERKKIFFYAFFTLLKFVVLVEFLKFFLRET